MISQVTESPFAPEVPVLYGVPIKNRKNKERALSNVRNWDSLPTNVSVVAYQLERPYFPKFILG